MQNSQVKIYEIKNWKNGLLDGICKQFFIDGTVKLESRYKKNIRYGKQTLFYPNGRVSSSGIYVDDLRSGVWQFFDEEGKIDTLINYNE